jgi:glutaredoxin 3
VAYEEIDVSDPMLRQDMMQRANGRRTVPQIFIGEHHIGGYDDMAALERRGQLDPYLA